MCNYYFFITVWLHFFINSFTYSYYKVQINAHHVVQVLTTHAPSGGLSLDNRLTQLSPSVRLSLWKPFAQHRKSLTTLVCDLLLKLQDNLSKPQRQQDTTSVTQWSRFYPPRCPVLASTTSFMSFSICSSR